jgi:ABC-type uncharacterized transport system substrate-binding protein
MRRREVLALMAGAIVCAESDRAFAQASKRALIGALFGSSAASSGANIGSFLLGMREHGYVEGQHFDLVTRFADGDTSRQPALAAELVSLRPDVIVTANTGAAIAVKQISSTPIVSAALDDPIGLGIAQSYARPGGQITGILFTIDTLPGKQLQIATEIVPRAKRAGVLLNPIALSWSYYRQAAEQAAKDLNVALIPYEVRSVTALDDALRDMETAGIDVLLVLPNPLFSTEGPRIAEAAARMRLPTLSAYRVFPSQGGLLSYGIDIGGNHRRAAALVDKILKGDKPANIPIELPTKYDLVVNLRLARIFGIDVPASILIRADEVIE